MDGREPTTRGSKTRVYRHARGGLDKLTKEGATPGEPARLVWGAAIEWLRGEFDDT
jgi:hypothetical protein